MTIHAKRGRTRVIKVSRKVKSPFKSLERKVSSPNPKEDDFNCLIDHKSLSFLLYLFGRGNFLFNRFTLLLCYKFGNANTANLHKGLKICSSILDSIINFKFLDFAKIVSPYSSLAKTLTFFWILVQLLNGIVRKFG